MSALKDIVTWQGFIGWQGVTCHHCGATHNVMCNIPCIRCERCRKFVMLSWSHWQMTHRKPDFGWNRSVLGWATINFGRYKEYLKQTIKDIANFQTKKKILL